jgi:hypothetical protein
MSNNTSIQSMPDPNTANVIDATNLEERELALKERELALKEKELSLKEQETNAKIELEKRGIWFTSPLLIGLASAIFGLIGTGVGAALQGYSNFQLERQKFDTNFQLERQKFEFTLIQKALDLKNREEAATQLIFLVDSGVIKSLDGGKIRKRANQPNSLPPPSGTAEKSWCLGMLDQWKFRIERFSQVDNSIKESMQEHNCSYWGIK